MNAEALIGKLPRSWTLRSVRNKNDVNSNLLYFNEITRTTAEDPRLDPLPSDWERVEKERDLCDPEHVGWFKNKTTDEVVNHDPRLAPEVLKKRGVLLETLRLV